MADFLVLAGRGINFLSRANAVTVTNEHASYPKANLYDGRPSTPFRFNSISSPFSVLVDMNLVMNGEFTDAFVGGLPDSAPTALNETGWAVSGSATSVAGLVGNAVSILSGGSFAQYDFVCRTGEILTWTIDGQPSTGGSARATIQNRTTGKFLDGTNSTWVASASARILDAAYNAGTPSAWYNSTGTFTVESFDTCGGDTCVLRVTLTGGNPSPVKYDQLIIRPTVNFASIHGHNVSTASVLTVLSGTTSSPATVRATMTPRQPSFYNSFAGVSTDQFWKFNFNTSPITITDPIWLGEAVLGQMPALSLGSTVVRHPAISPWRTQYRRPQVRVSGVQGEDFVATWGGQAARTIVIPLRMRSDAHNLTVLQDVVSRAGYGENPIIVVPNTDKTAVIFGRTPETWDYQSVLSSMNDGDLVVVEQPFPSIID